MSDDAVQQAARTRREQLEAGLASIRARIDYLRPQAQRARRQVEHLHGAGAPGLTSEEQQIATLQERLKRDSEFAAPIILRCQRIENGMSEDEADQLAAQEATQA